MVWPWVEIQRLAGGRVCSVGGRCGLGLIVHVPAASGLVAVPNSKGSQQQGLMTCRCTRRLRHWGRESQSLTPRTGINGLPLSIPFRLETESSNADNQTPMEFLVTNPALGQRKRNRLMVETKMLKTRLGFCRLFAFVCCLGGATAAFGAERSVHYMLRAVHAHLGGASQASGLDVWTYGGTATWDVVTTPGHYRLWAWRLFRDRMDGMFMWTYLSRDAWKGRSWDGGMVFAGNGHIVPSRRWELMRLGLQDWLLLDQAR